MIDFAPWFQNRGQIGYDFDMPEAAYRAFPAVNASLLVHPTPAQMHHSITAPGANKQTEATTLGTLAHIALLEPGKFNTPGDHFAECPTKGFDTKAADQARAENPGKLLITPELLEKAARIRREAVETNDTLLSLLQSPDGRREATCLTFDPEFLVMRKARIDYLPRKGDALGSYLLDIKTTHSPLYRFESEAWKFGYYMKAAWYLDTHELATGHRPERFIWAVVSTTEPFMARLYFMQNRRKDDPLYPDSKLRIARESLGLDESNRIGRLPSFVFAAQEHMQALAEGDSLDSPATARRIWTGYENEEPMQEIL